MSKDKFLTEDFLLGNETAKALYHECAAKMPIIDYHCHIPAEEIAVNKSYEDMSEIWLKHDHYKWRAMRSNGVSEESVTGSASPWKKFLAYADTLPHCIGNPLYHWTHLELKRYFDEQKILKPGTAKEIWEHCNKLLQKREFLPQSIIARSNVKVICTTDDPADDLRYHDQIAAGDCSAKVLPTFRPDKYLLVEDKNYKQNLERLAEVCNKEIETIEDLTDRLAERIEHFAQRGCVISDHALLRAEWEKCSRKEANEVLHRVLHGKEVNKKECIKLRSYLLLFLAGEYKNRGWAMQLHIGAVRNCNSRLWERLGPDTGFDAIGDEVYAKALVKLLDGMHSQNALPKTILYNLNPRDNEMLGTIIGCFQEEAPGKLQFGSGWWFCDQKDGMQKQMTALANLGVFGRFIGMLTDSRSVLSYTRHEYFRRILCNMLGGWVENGEYPADWEMLQKIVENICYNNVKNYLFGAREV